MKRAPIVLGGTAIGLGAILGYHTTAPSASATALTSAATTTAATTTAASATPTSRTATTAAKTSSSAGKARTATGEDVSYMYGELQVKVTMTGSKVTNISVDRLDVTDPRSQSIDQYALPQLRAEALSAQSAKIDGVSGASYTSQAYEQSLQAALDKLATTSSAA